MHSLPQVIQSLYIQWHLYFVFAAMAQHNYTPGQSHTLNHLFTTNMQHELGHIFRLFERRINRWYP